MSLLSFEPFFRDDIYACIYHFRIRLPKTCCISASYADLSPSKNFFSRHLSPDKTRKSHLDYVKRMSAPIDWKEVGQRLQQYKKMGTGFLNEALL